MVFELLSGKVADPARRNRVGRYRFARLASLLDQPCMAKLLPRIPHWVEAQPQPSAGSENVLRSLLHPLPWTYSGPSTRKLQISQGMANDEYEPGPTAEKLSKIVSGLQDMLFPSSRTLSA